MTNFFKKPIDNYVYYAVPYIDTDEGSSVRGYKVYADKKIAVENTHAHHTHGTNPDGSYSGPAKPLGYIEIAKESLAPEDLNRLNRRGFVWRDNDWSPEFRANTIFI